MSAPSFTEGLSHLPDALVEAVAAPLVDHHVHGCFVGPLDRDTFERSLNEGSPDPTPPFTTQFDSQLGFAVRRWCAPLVGLRPSVDAHEYWRRRAELGEPELARLLLPAAEVSTWLVDTGFGADQLCTPSQLADWGGGTAREILRLEALAETLAADGVTPRAFPDAFRSALAGRGPDVVGAKTIVAYRCGFDLDWTRPSDDEASSAYAAWVGAADAPRLTSPVLATFCITAAADAGLPIQFHVGLGDRDLDLHRVDPLLLLPLLRQSAISRVPVLLLHCYPFHRQAGYLAQAFPNVYMDVGLAVNHLGARSVAVLAESLELAPFAKQLYSSDAYGPAELHLLGSLLWRRGMAQVLARWVDESDWSLDDAIRVVALIGRTNAERVYQLR